MQKCWLLFLCKLFSPCKENPNMFELWAISDILSFLCLSWDVTNDNYQLLIHVTLLLWRSLPLRRRLSSTGLWTFPLCCRPTCMEETSWPITHMMRREVVGSSPFSEWLKACGVPVRSPSMFSMLLFALFFKTKPFSAGWDGLELSILLHQPPECWHYNRCAPLCPILY